MKIRNYLTEIRAEVNGTIQVFSGPMVPGTSFEEAQKYCEENGLGYCIVIGVEDEVTELKREIDRLQEKIKELETRESLSEVVERLNKLKRFDKSPWDRNDQVYFGTKFSPTCIEHSLQDLYKIGNYMTSDEIAAEKEAAQEKFFKELWEE